MTYKEEVLINDTPQETRVAVIANDTVQELYLERAGARGIVGNIFKGKVERVIPGMQAAFVDIGLQKNGFLHASDIIKRESSTTSHKDMTRQIPLAGQALGIQELVSPGESIWVQASKEPAGDKGARLTTDLSIASRNLVFLPLRSEVGVSQKIPSVTEQVRLLSIVKQEKAENSLQGGFIIRTLAESAQGQDIMNEMAFLERLWKQILSDMQKAPPASLVYESLPLMLRILRDLVGDDLQKIVIDSKRGFDSTTNFVDDFVPELAGKLEHYSGLEPLFDRYAVEQEIQGALQRKVKLQSGGNLVIDQTEALTSIDVNTGSFTGRRDPHDTLLKTNLEAARETAHQLKLRNLGGIIIIDFIDMADRHHRQKVLGELAIGLARDRVRTQVSEMSSLGLVEVTRQRTRASLAQIMCESCAVCEGSGVVKTAQTVCYEILRELLRGDRKFKARSYTIVAAPAVIELLLDQESAGLAELQQLTERPINLQVDKHYQQQQYDIALN